MDKGGGGGGKGGGGAPAAARVAGTTAGPAAGVSALDARTEAAGRAPPGIRRVVDERTLRKRPGPT